jgi:hypothetical protein
VIPFAEFAERLAHAVLGGEMAASRVQKDWDFTTDAGERVQVRYLANPPDRWVNEHYVDFEVHAHVLKLKTEAWSRGTGPRPGGPSLSAHVA